MRPPFALEEQRPSASVVKHVNELRAQGRLTPSAFAATQEEVLEEIRAAALTRKRDFVEACKTVRWAG